MELFITLRLDGGGDKGGGGVTAYCRKVIIHCSKDNIHCSCGGLEEEEDICTSTKHIFSTI